MEPDSDEDDEQEKKAEAVNTAAKDWGRVHLSPYTCYTHMGSPNWMVLNHNLNKMDDLGVPPF